MAADDCSLHFDLDRLTEKQAADHVANLELTALLQVATIAISKPADYVGLYAEFQQQPWSAILLRYNDFFAKCGIDPIPPEHFVFGPKMTFYQHVSSRLPDTELLSLYMVSGSNSILHQNPDALAISQNVNSKFHFAAHAPDFGISTPETYVTVKSELGSKEVADFLVRYADDAGAVMLKIPGLAGARNVTPVVSVQAIRDYVAEYEDDLPILLQQKLDLAQYTEMTVDLFVSDDDIHISNIREILFADGLWVGNFVTDRHALDAEQQEQLIKVGEYARAHGHSSKEGTNCGIDYFIGPEGDIIVTEINARWTGGLFPSQILARVNRDKEDAVMCFDIVPVDAIAEFLDFVEAHLPGSKGADFSTLSFGFSPFVQNLDGVSYIYVWQLIIGDFETFRQRKNAQLGERVLPTINRIALPRVARE
jgi:hypothetical protein